jgi:hypothetical protein
LKLIVDGKTVPGISNSDQVIKNKLKHKNIRNKSLSFVFVLLWVFSLNEKLIHKKKEKKTMKIRNNLNNIDEGLVKHYFPNANIVYRPEILEFNDPEKDVLAAEVTDWYGRTTFRCEKLSNANYTNHWPGEFNLDGDEDSCVSPCYWIFNGWRPICLNCPFV